MNGVGSWYDNALMESFFATPASYACAAAELQRGRRLACSSTPSIYQTRGRREPISSSISKRATIRDGYTRRRAISARKPSSKPIISGKGMCLNLVSTKVGEAHFISIDEWNQFARSLLVPAVRISEFLGQHSLLDPDPVEE